MSFIKKKLPGIIICVAVAGISTLLGGLTVGNFSLEVIGAPVFAILFGMIITLCAPHFASSDHMKEGVKFTSKKILQWAVIILGFSLNPCSQFTRPSRSAWPEVPCSDAISACTAISSPKSRTVFAPSCSRRPREFSA